MNDMYICIYFFQVQQALDGKGAGAIGGSLYLLTQSSPSTGYGAVPNREMNLNIYGWFLNTHSHYIFSYYFLIDS